MVEDHAAGTGRSLVDCGNVFTHLTSFVRIKIYLQRKSPTGVDHLLGFF
jgi:hypothetical protein